MRLPLLGALVTALAIGCQPPRTVLTARGLHEASDRSYDQHVVIAGRAQSLRARTPERGNPYTYFEIADGTGRMPAVGWGLLQIDSGDVVEVRGVYRAVVHMGSDVFRDAIEVSFVRRLRAAGQVPGTPSGPP